MIDRLLIARSLRARSSEEVAQLRSSGNGFAKVECNVFRHLHCFVPDHPCQIEQVLDGEIRAVTGSMANQPGHYRSCILLVPDINFE